MKDKPIRLCVAITLVALIGIPILAATAPSQPTTTYTDLEIVDGSFYRIASDGTVEKWIGKDLQGRQKWEIVLR
jgi:hypothetical protein